VFRAVRAYLTLLGQNMMKNPVKEKRKTSKVGPLDDAGPISFFFLLFDRHLHHHNLFNGLI